MKTIAERLALALEWSDERSVRSFHRQLVDDGLYDVTYSTVARYFSGEVEEPPQAFLRVAADLLGVRVAWLVLGEQPITEDAPQASREDDDPLAPVIRRHIRGLWDLPWSVAHALSAHVGEWERIREEGAPTVASVDESDDPLAYAKRVWGWIVEPLDGRAAPLDHDGFARYVTSALATRTHALDQEITRVDIDVEESNDE